MFEQYQAQHIKFKERMDIQDELLIRKVNLVAQNPINMSREIFAKGRYDGTKTFQTNTRYRPGFQPRRLQLP